MPSLDTLNRVKYSGLDFNTIEDEILTRLQVKFASVYNDFSVASLGIMLIDVFSFGLDTLSFYLDRRASDLFLTTARTRKSVARTARQLGYKMAPAVASSVDVTIFPVTAQLFAVLLPIGFQLSGPDGSIWEARESYTWPAGNNDPRVITFSQTKTAQSIYTSDGTPNQVFKISNVPSNEFIVGPGSDGVSQVTVEVNGQAWTENELLTFGETNQFEIGYNDGPPTLRFGDNIAGNIPAVGAQIRLTFLTSRGAAGTATAGQLTTPIRPLTAGFSTIPLTITNAAGSSGGSDPETIEKAKASAPVYFKSRGVNVTKEDYEIRASTFVDSVYGAIAVAKAVTVRSSAGDAVLQTLLENIVAVSGSYAAAVSSAVTAADSSLDSATAAITAAAAANATIATDLASIASDATSVSTSSATALSSSGMIPVFLAQVLANAASMQTTISGIPVGPDALSAPTSSALLSLIAAVTAAANNATTQASTVNSEVTSIVTSVDSIDTSTTAALADQSNIAAQLTVAATDVAAAKITLAALNVAVINIDNSVADIATQISDHVDSFLSSDCQSNLIEVPVLAFDSDKFYTAPTISLIKSLQTYLDTHKEVTQVVKVLAATNLLVPADIAVHVGVTQGHVEATVRSQVEARILNVLRGRSFSDNLKLSELYWVLNPENQQIEGLSFARIKIVGPVANIDTDGDLVIAENQVVTRGVIAITSEPVVA